MLKSPSTITKANARIRDKGTRIPVRAGDTIYRLNSLKPYRLDSWEFSPQGSTLRVVPSGKRSSEFASLAEFGLEVYATEGC